MKLFVTLYVKHLHAQTSCKHELNQTYPFEYLFMIRRVVKKYQ